MIVDGRVPLPLLAQPAEYRCAVVEPGEAGPELVSGYLQFFYRQLPHLVETAIAERLDAGVPESLVRHRVREFEVAFRSYLDQLPASTGRGSLDLLAGDRERDRLLKRYGFDDVFRLVKATETQRALGALPALIQELDGFPAEQRMQALIEGVFAGNVFDMGASETASLYASGQLRFADTRRSLRARPWLVDDVDRWGERLSQRHPYHCALLFVDNAGADIVLGMLPFARELLQRGARVILSANTGPSLNDVTHGELCEIVAAVGRSDRTVAEAYASGLLLLIASGSESPVLDLAHLSTQLADAVEQHGVDLVALEGMGRALNSNYWTRLSCDTLKIAMIKDGAVAERFGGQLFDLVFRFEAAEPSGR